MTRGEDTELLEKKKRFASRLMDWFEKNKRRFPWRPPVSPYRAAVAEVMLQKTSSTNALPVYEEFIGRYPTVEELADADAEAITEMLQPLGLPRRATLICQMAREVVNRYGGEFPDSEKELRKLPGIGPYGADAIASQAFGKRAPMIDINVMRIFHRVFSTPYKPRNAPTKNYRAFVLSTIPEGEETRFNLALLDFGALVCTSRNPKCEICPMAMFCDYYQRHRLEDQ